MSVRELRNVRLVHPPADGPRSVLLVEDDAMVRGWIIASLEQTEFRVDAALRTAAEAVEIVPRSRADVLLVDLRLPDERGAELIRRLRAMGVRTPALLMTAVETQGLNELAREVAAQGTILKSGDSDHLLAALRAVAARRTWYDERHPPRDRTRSALTPRERDVLRLVARGRTNPEIAAALSVSRETVKTLLDRIYDKLGVRRRGEAVAAARDLGVI
jgi:DNA-binding NarL/FixJ family response regulator